MRTTYPPDGSKRHADKLFILCGHISEFDYWARRIWEKTHDYEIRYINQEHNILGYREQNYICLGNWFRLHDDLSEKSIHIMRHQNFKELMYSDIFGFESEEAEREYYENSGGPVPMSFEEFLSEEEMLL